MSIFTRNLAARMRERGMTQQDLAAAAGTARPSVNRILHGKENPTLHRAERLAKAVGATLQELLAEKLESTSNLA